MVSEGYVEVGGVRIRYLESGRGTPLVHLPGAGELHLAPAHELLAGRFRVLVVELPDGGSSPEALSQATTRLGLERFDLMAASRGAEAALRLALAEPGRVRALVLEAPTAIGPAPGSATSSSASISNSVSRACAAGTTAAMPLVTSACPLPPER